MAKISKQTGRGGKSAKHAAVKSAKAAAVKSAKARFDVKVLGVTKDGVRILKPKGKPTHFTQKELRSAIASVRAAKRA